MFCKNCGNKLRDEAVFCPNCGKKIITTVPANQAGSVQPQQTAQAPQGVQDMQVDQTSGGAGGVSRSRLLAGIIGGVLVLCVVIGAVVIPGNKKDDTMADAGGPENLGTAAVADEAGAQEQGQADMQDDAAPMQEQAGEQEPEGDAPDSNAAVADEAAVAEDTAVVEDTAIHIYELIVEDVTWTEAYYDCINRGGHLVRINTEEEFNVIADQIRAEDRTNITFWISANRLSGSSEYHWLREDGTYTEEVLNSDPRYASFWLDGEPSFTGADDNGNVLDESCVDMFYRSSEDRFYWNDAPDDIISAAGYYAGRVGYICEYDN